MIKNIFFDIGGVITRDEGAKAIEYLDKTTQKELNDIVFYTKGFIDVLYRKYII